MCGNAYLHPKKTPSKLTSCTFFQTSNEVETMSAPRDMPALLSKILIPLYSSITSANTVFQLFSLVTSSSLTLYEP